MNREQNSYCVFTDGSCNEKKTKLGCGVVILQHSEGAHPDGLQTKLVRADGLNPNDVEQLLDQNNALTGRKKFKLDNNMHAEAYAVLDALRGLPDGSNIILHTDPITLVEAIQKLIKGQKPRGNPTHTLVQIYQEIGKELRRHNSVSVIWANDQMNNLMEAAHWFALSGVNREAYTNRLPLSLPISGSKKLKVGLPPKKPKAARRKRSKQRREQHSLYHRIKDEFTQQAEAIVADYDGIDLTHRWSEPPRAKARGITLVQAALVQYLLLPDFGYSA